MAFCKYCGAQNDDGAEFCQNCGASLTGDAAPASPEAPAAKPTVNKTWLMLGGAVVGAVVIIALLVSLLGGRGPEKTAKAYVEALYKGDAKAIVNLMPDEYVEHLCDRRDLTRKELISEIDERLEDSIDYLNDEYGKKWKVSTSVLRTKELKDNDVEDKISYYENYYDIDMNIKAASKVRLEMTIKAGKEEESTKMELTVLKIGGKWYMDPDNVSF